MQVVLNKPRGLGKRAKEVEGRYLHVSRRGAWRSAVVLNSVEKGVRSIPGVVILQISKMEGRRLQYIILRSDR